VSICLVDTTIFCEVLEVPHMCSDHKGVLSMLRSKIKNSETLLLPMATILETGNHIGQNGDGNKRRQAAQRFTDMVTKAIQGTIPFTPTPFFDAEVLSTWLSEFPDWAMRNDAKGKGSGLGDLSIQKEWVHQCDLHPNRRVYVWSKDVHLSALDNH
jgi:hypothetical protein